MTTDAAIVSALVEANLEAVRRRIAAACERSDRRVEAVRLVGVTKGVFVPAVRAAIDAGLRDIGENYVQEAALRRRELAEDAGRVRWHLIGSLQTNKVNAALGLFDVLQAVDSLRLAEAISRRATARVPVLLEVNVSGEASKAGLTPAETGAAVDQVRSLPNIDLRGLMTIAPFAPDPEQVRPVFRALRELAQAHALSELSMGMTGDFEVAIEEGATMVRIGRAIFGERSK